MPPSMRRQTHFRKQKEKKRIQQAEGRSKAVELLQDGRHSLREITNLTGVPKSTVGELKELLRLKDQDGIERKLNKTVSPGRRTVLSSTEQKMIVDRLLFGASRGFAMGVDDVRDMMSRIAADGRVGWKNGVPSPDAVRAFRARYRELTFRNAESKEIAKLNAENYEHVQHFFGILTDLDRKHKGLLANPNRIVNMDETAVDATYGKREKVFTASTSHHGGFKKEHKTG